MLTFQHLWYILYIGKHMKFQRKGDSLWINHGILNCNICTIHALVYINFQVEPSVRFTKVDINVFFLLYKFIVPMLNYRCYEFVGLTNLCETGLLLLVLVRGILTVYFHFKSYLLFKKGRQLCYSIQEDTCIRMFISLK